MNRTVEREFERKAPLVDPEELVEVIEHKLFTPELRDRTDSIWLHGSFVTPGKDIDTGEEYSDMDVVAVVPEWDLPPAGPGIVIFAPETDLVHSEVVDDDFEWTYSYQWESAEKAYELLPEYARESFVQSLHRFFHASEADREEGVFRQYDLRICHPDHLDYYPHVEKLKQL